MTRDAPRCGCPCSTSSPTRGSRPTWPSRRRRPAGTGSSSGTTSAGGSRSRPSADPWITLAAVAAATERLRLGPMVTPLARRRPGEARPRDRHARPAQRRAARPSASGSGGTGSAASTRGPARRSTIGSGPSMLDESLEILRAAWTGEPVHHHGEHYVVDGMRFLPRPRARRGPGLGRGLPGNRGRAAGGRYDGFFPVNLTAPDQLAEAVAGDRPARGPGRAIDVVAAVAPGVDPALRRRRRHLVLTDAEAEGHDPRRRARLHRRRTPTLTRSLVGDRPVRPLLAQDGSRLRPGRGARAAARSGPRDRATRGRTPAGPSAPPMPTTCVGSGRRSRG